jgi:hypothetical protein
VTPGPGEACTAMEACFPPFDLAACARVPVRGRLSNL